ncbi:MAG: Bug family tripartite tricarboxylate transporter substrate binding protein [Tropicimonas sp.]|uniref:Bug family tripartite tricarboxylate transporter substrate binding protein n=1 Tax=Tropicimonas sp. TaxID=2067044 RepID=UPI003A872995
MTTIAKLLASAALALTAGSALAADYPDRPVTILVPWGAGGGTDTIIRIFAIGFEEAMGQPINVVNRDGGSGVVGHAAIAQAKPDGYTLGACTPEITYFKSMGIADLTPENYTLISRLALIPSGITVAKDSPYDDVGSILEAFKAEPAGTFSSSGSGVGGTWHMATAGVLKALGEPVDKIDFIPSKGGAPALQDMVSGGLNLFTGSPVEAKALADAGEVKILAVMSDERSPAFPDVPTLKESGLDFSIANWFSLCGPAGIPEDVVAKIAAAAEEAHGKDVVQDALAQRGITPYFDGPADFSDFAAGFADEAGELLGELGLVK